MERILNNNKGITLLVLVITIIIMLILASVVLLSAFGENGIVTTAREEKDNVRGEIVDKEAAQWKDESNKALKEGRDPEQSLEDILDYLVGKEFMTEGEKNKVLNDAVNREVQIGQKIVNFKLGSYLIGGNWNGRVNEPVLDFGMRPVYWDSALNEIILGDVNFKWEEWYEYIEQSGVTDGKTSRWANAITEDGNYWVWIPRFEYKIDYTGVVQGVATDTTKAGKIHVRFIPTTTKSGSPGYTTDANGIVRSSDGYIVHPVFTNNINQGGWHAELDGFWIAKYQASMENSSGSGVTTTNTTIGNVALSNNVRMSSKPNRTAWRYINIANAYENSYNYDRKRESHLIKNSEWGAVAYLTHSQYGRNATKVTANQNSSYQIGGGTGTAFKTNQTQSSTGNVYGVYDLVGAACEYVATFNKAYTLGGFYSDPEYMNARGTHFASVGGKSTRYVTAYYNNTLNPNVTSLADFTSGGKNVSNVGDGIHEVWIRGNSMWFSSNMRLFSLATDTPPTYKRGQNELNETALFTLGASHGWAASYNGFRVTLCPTNNVDFRYYMNIEGIATEAFNTTTINTSFTVKNHNNTNFMLETLNYNIDIVEGDKWKVEVVGGDQRTIVGGAKRSDLVEVKITAKNGVTISDNEPITLVLTTTFPRNDVRIIQFEYRK